MYIPCQSVVIAEVLKANHDDPAGGHFGMKHTDEIIHNKYFWHGMMCDIKSHCNTCNTCQHVKACRHKPYGELDTIPQPTNPFEVVTMDFITSLPPSHWHSQVYDAVLVMIDVYCKYAIYLPCHKDITVEELAELLYERFFTEYSTPCTLVSDHESLFTSKFWSSLLFFLGVRQCLSTAYHLQTDGQTECQNQLLEHYLHCYTNFEQDDWA